LYHGIIDKTSEHYNGIDFDSLFMQKVGGMGIFNDYIGDLL